MIKILSTLAAFLAMIGFPGSGAGADYIQEVKPLLASACFKCHGASQQKGGLRLDTAAFALKGGDTGPAFKAGHSEESLLIQVVRGTHADIARMPYKKPPLTGAQIDLLKAWIDEGAKAPANEAPETARHWAFIPPERPEPPALTNANVTIRNPIDAFVLERLAREKIAPSPEADRVTLIRRLSLDLLGLPPKIEDVEKFASDTSPDAYERLVERLLASPHYGERWGRHWLDVARYSDSNGYSLDGPRQIWKYRDWVVEALNRDLPFDQFVTWQLAGDLLPGSTLEQKIATGFHRNTQINQEGGIDPEQFRIESVMDRVSTTATAFLGVTLGCAQCHDHKFDPLKQKEYYQMFAIFNNTEPDGHGKGTFGPTVEVAPPEELAKRETQRQQVKKLEADLKKYTDELDGKQAEWEMSLTEEMRGKLKTEAQSSLAVPAADRTEKQKADLAAVFRAQDAGYKERTAKIARLKRMETPVTTTLVMKELSQPRESFLFIKGDFTRHGEAVGPGVPEILSAPGNDSASNRLDLARWIVDAKNPLTARVMVNRLWQEYFGKGLVETENDFGTQGIPPLNPALLDWLATEFMRQKWSLKAMHRLIVNSATYRQSSRARPDLSVIDPSNKLLARQNRLRLDAEVVRDVALSASGLLSEKIGGPPVYPPQPDGVMNLGQSRREWKTSPGEDRHRRGLYTFLWRATPHPALAVFDAPDALSACTRRLRSNTPLQALTLLNDAAFYECAESLAARTLKEGPSSNEGKLEFAFQLCLSRKPGPAERQRLGDLLKQESAVETGEKKELSAWTTVARVLLNLDETITRE